MLCCCAFFFLQNGHDFLLPNAVVHFDCGAVKTTGEKSPSFIWSSPASLVINTGVVRQRAGAGDGKAAQVEGHSSLAVWPHLALVQGMAKPHAWTADLDEGNTKAWGHTDSWAVRRVWITFFMSQRSPLVSQPDLLLEATFPSMLSLIKISENSQHQWLGKEEELSVSLFPTCCYLHDSLVLIVCFQNFVSDSDKKRENLQEGNVFFLPANTRHKTERCQVLKDAFSHTGACRWNRENHCHGMRRNELRACSVIL